MRVSVPIHARRLAVAGLAVAGWTVAIHATGCASPTISAQGARITEETPNATVIAVDLELKNPADDTMRLFQWDYVFSSANASYRGLWEAQLALPPANVPMRTSLPCVIPTSDLDRTAPWTLSGTLTYRSPSRLALIPYDLGLYRPSQSFSVAGTGITAAPASASTPSVGAVR